MVSSRRVALSIAWLFAACVAAVPPLQAYPMPPEFYKLSEQLVSWHIPWAKPYAGGAIKALVIAPRGAQRETIELAERLDLDYTYVLTLSPTELGWTAKSSAYATAKGISNEEMLQELRAKLLPDYDVIIIGHQSWKVFPNDVLYTIMKKIHDGTGLVYTYSAFGQTKRVKQMLAKGPGSDPTKFVTTGVPFAALPVLDEMGADKVVGLKRFKDGRIVTLDYGKRRPRFEFLTPAPADDVEWYTDLHYEYYMSLVAKAVIWAAKREPKLCFRSWGNDGAVFQRGDLAKTKLAAALTGAAAPGQVVAAMTVRDLSGKALLSAQQSFVMDAADKTLEFALEPLPRGRYFADLVLRRGKRTVNWATTYFDVETPVAVASIETDKEWYEVGQTVKTKVALSAPLPKNMRVVVAMEDSLGRKIAELAPPVEPGTESFDCAFTIANPLTIMAKVRVTLLEAGAMVATQTKEFSIVRRKWDDFRFCVWTAGSNFNERVRRLMFKQIIDAGVDTFTNSSRTALCARRAAEWNFCGIPYMTRYCYSGKDLVRKPCLTDPKFLANHLQQLEDTAREQRPFDPQGYTLGDECFFSRGGVDVCFSPTCNADLREWLRTQYKSVAELNASWGTSYKSFDQAEPITLADAKSSGQIARWVDHRRHMEFVYARMLRRARDAIRKADPTARVGFDGPFATDSVSGNDWWQIMNVFGLCNVYFHQPDEWEHVRSFAKPGTMLGLWYGGYRGQQNEDYARFFPWRAVLHGFNSVWWYAVYHGLSTCPMDAVTPSMTKYPYFAATAEENREIKAGVGKTLMNATRLDDAIAVHYSQSSVHAATAYAGIGNLCRDWRLWYALLEDAGFQYTARAYAQIEQNGIDPARYRVLILPYSQAVSPIEAKRMEEFVRAGGTLLADLRPGVADQHGKLQSPGLLDAVFGIRRVDGKLDLAQNQDAKLDVAVGAAAAGVTIERVTIDPNVALAGAKAMAHAGQTPLIIVNQVGKGRAVLLNFGLTAYNTVRNDERADTYWNVLKGIFAMAGVKPRVSIQTANGPMRKCETAFFRDGDIEYVGFLKYRCSSDEPPQDAKVALDGKAHTYDVHKREYLGYVDRFAATFEIERGKLYSRLPYTVEAVAVKPKATTVRPGDAVRLDLSLRASAKHTGRHWFHVAVFGPDKVERRQYALNVAVVNGSGQALIPLALNDARGAWRIAVRDVASGISAQAFIDVK